MTFRVNPGCESKECVNRLSRLIAISDLTLRASSNSLQLLTKQQHVKRKVKLIPPTSLNKILVNIEPDDNRLRRQKRRDCAGGV